MDPVVIGFVGKTASGKGMVANILEEKMKDRGWSVSRLRFSDALREFIQELRKRGINLPMSKINLISIAEAGKLAFVPDFLAQSMIRRTKNCQTNLCIWDGLRWPDQDLPALRSFSKNMLVAITADNEVRYQRFIKRKENWDDAMVSFADFEAMDSRDTEKCIPDIMEKADTMIHNNEDDFRYSPPMPSKVIEVLDLVAHNLYRTVSAKK